MYPWKCDRKMYCEFLSVLLFIEMLLQKNFEPIVKIRLSFHFVIDIGDFSLCKCLDSSLLYNAINIWFFQRDFDFNIKKCKSCKVYVQTYLVHTMVKKFLFSFFFVIVFLYWSEKFSWKLSKKPTFFSESFLIFIMTPKIFLTKVTCIFRLNIKMAMHYSNLEYTLCMVSYGHRHDNCLLFVKAQNYYQRKHFKFRILILPKLPKCLD